MVSQAGFQLPIFWKAGVSGRTLTDGDESFVPMGVIDKNGKLIPEAPPPITPPVKPPVIKALPAPTQVPRRAPAGVVEVRLSGRVKMIRIQGDVNTEALQSVLAVARELA
jgi:hypothetical protein